MRKMMPFLNPGSLLTVARLLLASGALVGAVIETGAAPTPWAVLKCKFSDQPQEPAFDSALITGPNGMAGYWLAVSYGQISLNGTTILPANGGWYTLPFTLAQAQAFPVNTRRNQIIDACITAAASDLVTGGFYSVIAILNAKIDSGASGGRVVLDPDAWNNTFAAHELGHGYGLAHSWSADPDIEYGDRWDIMSAMSVHAFQGSYGSSNATYKYDAGPGLIALNLEKKGWLPANRIVTWGPASQTVTLAALNHPGTDGYFMAKVPFDAANPDRYYSVEFRRKTGWDQGIPQDTVLIHERRANGLFYLIQSGGGPERLPGQTFRDINNNVAITVLDFNTTLSTATVNIGRNEVWVDFNYQGATELGTFGFPYNTLAEGVNIVAYNGTLKIKAGSRNETATVSRKMNIEAYGGPVTIGQ